MDFYKEIDNTIYFLSNGKTILYPTDTIWGIGCDATDEIAVKKIYRIKQRDQSKSLIILVDSFEMLQNYINPVPKKIKTYLFDKSEPITVIYKNPTNLARNLIAKDNTIAIRIVKEGFSNELIKKFGEAIVSTSANISGVKTPLSFEKIDNFFLKKVDYIVTLQKETSANKSSKIIKLENDKIVILRE